MPKPQNNEQALAWLEKAHELLKTRMIFSPRSAMKADLSALDARMRDVRAKLQEREVEFDATYLSISSDAHDIEQSNDSLELKRTKLGEIALRVKALLVEITKALAAQALYAERKQSTDSHIEALVALNLAHKSYQQPLVTALIAAKGSYDLGEYPEAAEALANIKSLKKTQEALATADHKAVELYKSRKSEAAEYVAELINSNLAHKTYQQPLVTALTAAEGSYDLGEYPEAAEALANIKSLKKTQKALATADHKAVELYKSRKSKAAEYVAELINSNLAHKTYQQPLVTALTVAEGSYDLGEYPEAAEALANIKSLKKTQAALATADHKADEAYKKAKQTAEEYAHELKLLELKDKQYDGPLLTALQKAKQRHDLGEYLEAPVELRSIATLFKDQKKLAASDRSNAVEDARYKAVYEDKCARIREAIRELDPQPGTSAIVTGLNGLLTKGNLLAAPGKYEDAYKALKGLSGLLESGRAAAKGFVGQAGDAKFQKARATARTALHAYTGRFELADPNSVKTHEGTYTTILKTLEGTPDQPKIQTATSDMNTLATTLNEQTAAAKLMYESCKEQIDVSVDRIRDAQLYATSTVFAPLFKRYRNAQGLMGLLNFKEAKTAYTALNQDLTSVIEEHKPAYDSWKTTQKKVLAGPLKKLQDISFDYNSEYFQDLGVSPGALLGRYKTAEIQVVTSHDYPAATVVAQQVLDAVKTGGQFVERVQSIKDNAAVLLAADELIGVAKRLAEDAIERLNQAEGDTAPFQSRLDGVGTAWSKEKGLNVLKGNDLAICREVAITDYKAITTDVVAIIGDDGDNDADKDKLEESKATAAAAKAQANFETAWRKASVALKAAMRGEITPSAEAQRLSAALVELTTKSVEASQKPTFTPNTGVWTRHNALVPLVGTARDMLVSIASLVETRDRERDTARAQANTHATAAQERIKALIKARARFKPYLVTVERTIEDLASTAASAVTSVVEGAEARLKGGGDVDLLLQKLEAPNTFDDILTKKSAAKRLLEGKVFKTVRPDVVASSTTRYEEHIKPQMAVLPPEQALALVTDFHEEVKEESDKATISSGMRDTIREKTTEAETELEKLVGVPDLKKDLAGQIKNLKDFTPGCETSYLIKIGSLLGTLRSITAQGPDALERKDKMEQVVRQRALEAELREKSLEGALAVFDKNLAKKAKATKDDTPSDRVGTVRYEAIGTCRVEAGDQLKKGLLAEAEDKLKEAIRLADAFIADPFNPTASAARNLKKTNTAYQKAVIDFARQVNVLSAEIKAAAEDDPLVDVVAATKPFERLPTLFDVNKFTALLPPLTEPATVAQLRATKENALRFVRVYQERFDKDPVLKYLAGGTPFQAQVALSPIKTAIAQLEVDVLGLG